MTAEIRRGSGPPAYTNYPELWNRFQSERSDLFGLLSRMPVSFIVRRTNDNGIEARQQTTVADLLGMRLAETTHVSTYVLADKLGISEPAVVTLVNGTLGYISEETGLPFNPSLGIVAKRNMRLIATRIHEQRAVEMRFESGTLSTVEEEVARMYLLGHTLASTAQFVTKSLALKPGLSEAAAARLMRDLLGVQESRATVLPQRRVVKARELIEAEGSGLYHNRKAEASLEILRHLEEGSSRAGVMEEMAIDGYTYKTLLREAFIDLRQDRVGRRDLAGLFREISLEPFQPLPGEHMNKIYRMMLRPYRELRLRLGDGVLEDGRLNNTLLSPRERAFLDAISAGLNRRTIIAMLDVSVGYWQALSKFILEETLYLTHKQLNAERREMLDKARTDIKTGSTDFVLRDGLNGISAVDILEHLAGGLSFEKTARTISEQTGTQLSEGAVINFYGKVRAHYRNK